MLWNLPRRKTTAFSHWTATRIADAITTSRNSQPMPKTTAAIRVLLADHPRDRDAEEQKHDKDQTRDIVDHGCHIHLSVEIRGRGSAERPEIHPARPGTFSRGHRRRHESPARPVFDAEDGASHLLMHSRRRMTYSPNQNEGSERSRIADPAWGWAGGGELERGTGPPRPPASRGRRQPCRRVA